MLGLTFFTDTLGMWLKNLEGFWNFLTEPGFAATLQQSGQHIATSSDSFIDWGIILKGIGDLLAYLFGQNTSLLGVILGGWLGAFVIYTILKWILDIIF